MWLYWAGVAVVIGWSFVPSSVTFTFHWIEVPLGLLLLGGLTVGSRICRWTLIFFGVYGALSVLALQSGSLDLVATTWSVLALCVTGLLFLPSIRSYTRSSETAVERREGTAQ